MTEELLVTPDTLRGRASEIQRLKMNHEDIINQLTNLMSYLCSEWDGFSQEALVSEYINLRGFFDDFSNTLQEFSDLAKTTADEVEAEDNELARKIRSI